MTSFIRVAPPAEQCPAKTWIDESGINRLGRSVADHCLIVGTIAKELQKLFPETISSIFPSGSALIAACHDVGKISPTFFLRLELMAGISDGTVKELLQETSFTDNPEAIRQYESERWGGHPGVSFVTMMELTHDHNIATVVGQHHGSLPKICNGSVPMMKILGALFGKNPAKNLSMNARTNLKNPFPPP